MNPIKGLLIDIDGVLVEDGKALSGVVDKFNSLKKEYKIRLLTNTTTKTVADIDVFLRNQGFEVSKNEIITASVASQLFLKQRDISSIYPVVSQNILHEYEAFTIDKKTPEAIVIGDIGKAWNYDLLNILFSCLMQGAQLIALHKGKFWKSEGRLQLDIGAFIAGLEYASGKQALVIGKPSVSFFDMALQSMGLSKKEVVMIGDDIDGDIGGAQNLGIKAYLVKTGKYNEQFVASSDVEPDEIIEGFEHLNIF